MPLQTECHSMEFGMNTISCRSGIRELVSKTSRNGGCILAFGLLETQGWDGRDGLMVLGRVLRHQSVTILLKRSRRMRSGLGRFSWGQQLNH